MCFPPIFSFSLPLITSPGGPSYPSLVIHIHPRHCHAQRAPTKPAHGPPRCRHWCPENPYRPKYKQDSRHTPQKCYDSIRLGLGPIPELRPAQSDPWVFQPSRIARCDASCDPAPTHVSVCLHALTHERAAPEGPCMSPAYILYSQSSI